MHAIWRDLFLYELEVIFLLNVEYAYFVYSHPRGGIITCCEHSFAMFIILITKSFDYDK